MTFLGLAGRSRRLLGVAALALALAPVAAAAGPAADKAAEAEALLGSGNAAAGFDALDAAVEAFWAEAPLTLRKAVLIDATGAPLAGPVSSGEAVHIAVEPAGYGFKEAGGTFAVSLSTAVEIRGGGGIVYAKSGDLGRLEWSGPKPDRSFTGRIGIGLPALKAGDYEIVLTVTDDASGKSATATLPVLISAP